MNKSADNNVNNIQAEQMSKKYSSTSNDLQSVSCRSGVNNLPKYEKELWKGIQSRMERTTSSMMLNKGYEKNPNEDRGEVNARIYDIKQVLSRIIDTFVITMKGKLEKYLNNVEYNDILVNGGSISNDEDTNQSNNVRNSAKTVIKPNENFGGVSIKKTNTSASNSGNKLYDEYKTDNKKDSKIISEFNLDKEKPKKEIEIKIENNIKKEDDFLLNTNINKEPVNSKPYFLSGSKQDPFAHIAPTFGTKPTLFPLQKKKNVSYKIKITDKNK